MLEITGVFHQCLGFHSSSSISAGSSLNRCRLLTLWDKLPDFESRINT